MEDPGRAEGNDRVLKSEVKLAIHCILFTCLQVLFLWSVLLATNICYARLATRSLASAICTIA